jgi:hypothetical protein
VDDDAMAGEDYVDRRRSPRVDRSAVVHLAASSERPVVGGRVVNISLVGILAAFAGPALPFGEGDRCLVSIQLVDGALHLLGHVRRRAYGDDDRLYIGIEYERVHPVDLERLERFVAGSLSAPA